MQNANCKKIHLGMQWNSEHKEKNYCIEMNRCGQSIGAFVWGTCLTMTLLSLSCEALAQSLTDLT